MPRKRTTIDGGCGWGRRLYFWEVPERMPMSESNNTVISNSMHKDNFEKVGGMVGGI